jgi:hypothetical protein
MMYDVVEVSVFYMASHIKMATAAPSLSRWLRRRRSIMIDVGYALMTRDVIP